MIGIRTDGNNKIGIGHVMRCLTIAEELRRQDEDVMFLLADSSCKAMIEERGFESRILNSAYEHMEEELSELLMIINELSLKILLIDSYYVSAFYLNRVREKVSCVYLDDVNLFEYPVDLLINYNIFAKGEDYPYAKVLDLELMEQFWRAERKSTGLLAGPYYAPVRKEFLENRKSENSEVKDIMVSLGGSDCYNLSVKLAELLLEICDCKIHVVCGPFNIHKEELKNFAQNQERLTVHENVKEMWLLMKQCDLAISAAGSTMCELAVAGVPTLTFSFVDNQRKIAEEFAIRNAAVSVGHYTPESEEAFIEDIKRKVNCLKQNASLRYEITQNAFAFVDGCGAQRIAKSICACIRN